MVVDIDINQLLKLRITAEEYFLLRTLQKKGVASLRKYYLQNPKPDDDVLRSLVEKRLIHNANRQNEFDLEKIIVRNKFMEVSKPTMDLFEELYNLYPAKVTRPDGSTDYLRTDKSRCRINYTNKLKHGVVTHTDVMESLRFEISQRESDGSIAYMKRLPKWLSAEEWTTWKERLGDVNDRVETFGYGLNLE